MITDVVQRWRGGRASYELAGAPINTRLYEVAPIDGEGADVRARTFVREHLNTGFRHHYRYIGRVRLTRTTTHEQRLAWRAKFEQRTLRGEGCWLWRGSKLPTGYGLFYPAWRAQIYAHRFAWELEHDQPVPEGLQVMHSCDNPSCVNPAHLSAGTADDNMQDCVAKGRHAGAAPQGEDHYHHTLTEQNVRDIRAQHAAGVPPRVLAPKYGVSRKHIGLVVRRKAWKHVA